METDTREIMTPLCAPFFAMGAERVFVHDCCGWVVVATVPQAECRECKCKPASVEVSPTDLDPA